ncbi:unnamed protein product [Pylaiella littoralis]
MSLQQCTLSWQAFTTCASHAMSTEKQEVMGLLLGRWKDGGGGGGGGSGSGGSTSSTVTVDHAMILTRTDKREDRVEVGYKQLAEAADIAERMSAQLGQDTRVVGWYHSHPHITVLPSHVDVRTQGQYQSMDKRFIGLIFSVFSDDSSSKVGTIEVTAFQARDTSEVTHVDAGNEGGGGRGNQGGGGGAGGGGGGWERTEVALSLHGPGHKSSTTPLSDALERVVRLQDTLFGEERAGYLAALRQSDTAAGQEGGEESLDAESPERRRRRSKGADLLSKLFCSAVYSKSLAALSGDSAVPLVQTLRSQLNVLQNRAAALDRRRSELRLQLSPSELEEATSAAISRLRDPCSAGLGAFQAKHEGELDIPRADALRFAKEGAPLRRDRRDRILSSSTTPSVMVRIFREYPRRQQQDDDNEGQGERPGAGAGAGAAPAAALALALAPGRSSSGAWSTSSSSRRASRLETSETRKRGGGVWMVELAGKKKTLLGLRPTTAADEQGSLFGSGAGAGKRWQRGLVLSTGESAEETFLCDDQEAFRMWLGVAAAVFPSGGGACGGGD